MRRNGITFSPHFNTTRPTNATIRSCDCAKPTHIDLPELSRGEVVLQPGESPTIYVDAHRIAKLRHERDTLVRQLEAIRLELRGGEGVIPQRIDEIDEVLKRWEDDYQRVVDDAWGQWERDLDAGIDTPEPPIPIHPHILASEFETSFFLRGVEFYKSLHHFTAVREARFTAGWRKEMQPIHRASRRRSRRKLRDRAGKARGKVNKGWDAEYLEVFDELLSVKGVEKY
ncbi:hypothetical protein HDV00_000623 [Rhizophlyctis rosea]|nr:hypothetical protein HDV00_000623 [Rhizophlyctis rosea]